MIANPHFTFLENGDEEGEEGEDMESQMEGGMDGEEHIHT